MATPPNTLEEWLDKAKTFHGHKLQIDNLRSGNCSYPFCSHQSSSSWTLHDPNAMEVNFIKLKKLTPQEHAKCMMEGWCFKCRKVSHDAKRCRSSGKLSKPPVLLCHPSESITLKNSPVHLPPLRDQPPLPSPPMSAPWENQKTNSSKFKF